MYELAIKLKQNAYGKDHYSLAPIYINYGNHLERQNNKDLAI